MDFFKAEDRTIAGMRRPVPEGSDEVHMLRALELAEIGRGRTWPNPVVGAVVVSGGKVSGEGYHALAGGPHAEINALREAGESAAGATLYATLEPCAHQGRTPPCADSVLEAGIARVVIAMRDPNPEVRGGGATFLEKKGVTVQDGPYGEIAERQNEAYIKKVTTGMPFVTVKAAMSLDGKIATRTGDSRWISSEDSRRDAHAMRSESDAVIVGIGTVLADDPSLTVRMGVEGRMPLRVVVDSLARTPTRSRVADTGEAPTLVVVSASAPAERVLALEKEGVEVLRTSAVSRVDIGQVLEELGRRGMTSLMVEGGAELAYSMMEGGHVDKVVFYVAPMLIGGREAPGPVGGEGAERVDRSLRTRVDAVFSSGPDLKIVAYPEREA